MDVKFSDYSKSSEKSTRRAMTETDPQATSQLFAVVLVQGSSRVESILPGCAGTWNFVRSCSVWSS